MGLKIDKIVDASRHTNQAEQPSETHTGPRSGDGSYPTTTSSYKKDHALNVGMYFSKGIFDYQSVHQSA